MKTAIDMLLRDAARPQRKGLRLAAMLATLGSIAGIGLVAISGWFITAAAAAGIAGMIAAQAFNYLIPSAAIRLLAITRTGARYGERLLGHQAALRTLARLRGSLFACIVKADVADPARSSADGSARLIHDVDALEEHLVRAPTAIGALAGIAAALIAMALASPPAAALGLSAMLAAMAVARPLARRAAEAQHAVDRHVADLRRRLVAQAAAAADIAAYGLSGVMARAAGSEARKGDVARARLARLETLTTMIAALAATASVLAVLLLSREGLPTTMLAILAALPAGELLAGLLRAQGQAARTRGSRERLASLAEIPPVSAEPLAPTAAPSLAFTLDGLKVELAAGQRLAITGPSGCGKTRLLEAIAGWRDDPASLRTIALKLDGADVHPGKASARRRFFALAPQDALLIAGTVADNLRLARPGLRNADLWQALEIACLADDLRAMPEGLDAWAGDGGSRLSGGQRKRLSIARALLADRPWLFLDEPSEGLDADTEARLRTNLDIWLGASRRGLLMITHRPALLSLAPCRRAMAG